MTHHSLPCCNNELAKFLGCHSVLQINITWLQIQNVNEELNSGLPRTNPTSGGMEGLNARFPAYDSPIQNSLVTIVQ